jgi:nicotinamidase/pyrazinamidase
MASAGKTGVIVVDFQADFTTYRNGSLAVPDSGEDYIQKVRSATKALSAAGFTIFATLDWHPSNHISFYTSHPGTKPFETLTLPDGRTQVMWPPHCVQGTPGAENLIDPAHINYVIHSATDPDFESYSGFRDDGGGDTGLDDLLKKEGITTVVIYGIATDYCVKATALDAVKAGYRVVLVKELCRGVAPDTSQAALKEMETAGIDFMETFDLEAIKHL